MIGVVVASFACGVCVGAYVVLELAARYGRRRTGEARVALRSGVSDERVVASVLRPRSGLVTRLPGEGNAAPIDRVSRR